MPTRGAMEHEMGGLPNDATNFDRKYVEKMAGEIFEQTWLVRTGNAWLQVIRHKPADNFVGQNGAVQQALEGLMFHAASSKEGTVKVSGQLMGALPTHIKFRFFENQYNTLPRYLEMSKGSTMFKQFHCILMTICSSLVYVLSESGRCNVRYGMPSFNFPSHYTSAELLEKFKTKLLDSRDKISPIYTQGEYLFEKNGIWKEGCAPHFEMLCDLLRIVATMNIVLQPQWHKVLENSLVTDILISKMGLAYPWDGLTIPRGNPFAYPHHKTRVLADERMNDEETAQVQMAIALSLSEAPDDQAASGMPGSSADNGGPDDTSVVVDSDESDDVEDGP